MQNFSPSFANRRLSYLYKSHFTVAENIGRKSRLLLFFFFYPSVFFPVLVLRISLSGERNDPRRARKLFKKILFHSVLSADWDMQNSRVCTGGEKSLQPPRDGTETGQGQRQKKTNFQQLMSSTPQPPRSLALYNAAGIYIYIIYIPLVPTRNSI